MQKRRIVRTAVSNTSRLTNLKQTWKLLFESGFGFGPTGVHHLGDLKHFEIVGSSTTFLFIFTDFKMDQQIDKLVNNAWGTRSFRTKA